MSSSSSLSISLLSPLYIYLLSLFLSLLTPCLGCEDGRGEEEGKMLRGDRGRRASAREGLRGRAKAVANHGHEQQSNHDQFQHLLHWTTHSPVVAGSRASRFLIGQC